MLPFPSSYFSTPPPHLPSASLFCPFVFDENICISNGEVWKLGIVSGKEAYVCKRHNDRQIEKLKQRKKDRGQMKWTFHPWASSVAQVRKVSLSFFLCFTLSICLSLCLLQTNNVFFNNVCEEGKRFPYLFLGSWCLHVYTEAFVCTCDAGMLFEIGFRFVTLRISDVRFD